MSMKISVVIPAYNAQDSIRSCLTSLQEQTYAHLLHEIIVVDNQSTDRTAEIAAQFAQVSVLNQSIKGAAAARNLGIAQATGDVICFTDADCAPTTTWLQQLCEPLEQNADIIATKGTYLTAQSEMTARFVQIEYEDKYDLLRPQKYINFIDTYSAAYRREVLVASNGGFDESVMYVEDQELSFRLAARGYKMIFQPEAVVYHRHSNTLWKYFYKKFMIGYWKAQIVSRFPQRGVNDSHTPQVMKIQMALIMLFLASIAGQLVLPLLRSLAPQISWGWLSLATPLLFGVFTATTIPFVRKAWPKDRAVALASPFLLVVRAAALSFGYLLGVLKPHPLDEKNTVAISGFDYLLKRSLDIFGATIGLFFTILLYPCVAIAIKSESTGPIIFRQRRIGQEGSTLYDL